MIALNILEQRKRFLAGKSIIVILVIVVVILFFGVLYPVTTEGQKTKNSFFRLYANRIEVPVEAKQVLIEDLSSVNSGLVNVQGYVVERSACRPCRPGNHCSLCTPPGLRISDQNFLEGGNTMWVFFAEPERFKVGGFYEFSFDVAGSSRRFLGAQRVY